MSLTSDEAVSSAAAAKPLQVPGVPPSLRSASVALAVAALAAAALNVASPTAAVLGATTPAPALERIHLAVIMVILPTSPAFVVSVADVRATYFSSVRSVATLYRAASRGTLDITGDVFGPYQIAIDDSTCAVSAWAEAAEAAAVGDNVDLSSYTNFAFLFPRTNVCPWAGLAVIGGTTSYINAPAKGDVGLYHAAHELGHDLGAGHAHSIACAADGSAVSLADPNTCTSDEYGDPFSLMGSGIVRLPSAWERVQMGLLASDEIAVLDSGTVGSFDIANLDSTGTGTRIVMLGRADGGYLTIEYRRSGGAFDTFAGSTTSDGVFVHYVAGDVDPASSLLDATPDTSSMSDAFIAAGARLDDNADSLSINVTSTDAGSAQATIGPLVAHEIVGTPPPPPSSPAGLKAVVGAGSLVHLSWTAAADASSATRYRVSRRGVALATVASTGFDDTTVLTSRARYGVVALNADGIASSATTVVARPLRTPGAVSAWATIRGQSVVTIHWTVVTAGTTVARYCIEFSTGRTVYTRNTSISFHHLRNGQYVVIVSAVNAAGRAGAASTVRFSL